MKIYFYDENNRYIGSRELREGEVVPTNATTMTITLTNRQEAHLVKGAWVVNNVEIPIETQTVPEPDPDVELATAISAATTIAQLKDALLGNGKLARVKGKIK